MATIGRILVVCTGNVCRSPLGERLLQGAPGVSARVGSAGLGALAGAPADATTARVAAARGVSLDGHVARQFTPGIGAEQDLILVMEPGHRRAIAAQAPELQGRVMLFGHWTGAAAIPDPYRREARVHEAVFDLLEAAVAAWAGRLG